MRNALAVLAWIGITFSTLFWTLLIALDFLLHRLLDPDLKIAHRLASCWGRMLVRMAPGTRVEVVGKENIPAGRPVVFMANHQSYVDVPTLFFIPAQFKWMADEGLFRIPVFGWALRMAGYIPVCRGDPRQGFRALERANGWLRRGISVFIFPEGTRSHTGVLGRFQTGGFRLAVLSQKPVVPVLVTGTRQLLPRGSWSFRWGVRLRLTVLEPVNPPADSTGIRQFSREIRSRMRGAYAREIRALRSEQRNVLP